MKWKIEYIKEAQRDLKKLDPHSRKLILKAIEKRAENPLPPPDGNAKPLGNHSGANLRGYFKIKLRDMGYRIVYGLKREHNIMKIIIIGIRDDEAVYKEAEQRIQRLMSHPK